MFIIVISFYGFYTNYKQSFQNNAENVIQEETQNNIINENNTNDDTTLNILNSTNEIKEINNKEVEKTSKEKNITQDKREATKENNKTDTTNKEKEKEKKTSEKPANKDFLFTEGYTMDNVTQAAQDYLKSSDDIKCNPCYKTKCPTNMECMSSIKVENILEKIKIMND